MVLVGKTVLDVPVPKLLLHVTVPPQLVAESALLWPELMLLGFTDKVGASGLGFTVTETLLELVEVIPLTVQVAT